MVSERSVHFPFSLMAKTGLCRGYWKATAKRRSISRASIRLSAVT
jgi:hypothetical protein